MSFRTIVVAPTLSLTANCSYKDIILCIQFCQIGLTQLFTKYGNLAIWQADPCLICKIKPKLRNTN
jgi:hypothetical protein